MKITIVVTSKQYREQFEDWTADGYVLLGKEGEEPHKIHFTAYKSDGRDEWDLEGDIETLGEIDDDEMITDEQYEKLLGLVNDAVFEAPDIHSFVKEI